MDNLKLGYGGTKTEMERLLADATKLTGVKYDINNLSDVYDAIHAVQEELDITGTTAKESAETFSGSLASMKAAFSNFLGNLSLGRDVAPSLNALAQTVSTFFFGNFLPMIGNILKALPGSIVTFISAMGPALKSGFGQLFEGLISSLDGLGGDLGTTFADNLRTSFENVASIVTDTIGPVLLQIPALFEAVASTVTPIIDNIVAAFAKLDFSGIKSIITSVVPAITNAFQTMMSIVSPAIDGVITSFAGLWDAVQPLLSILADALMPVLQVIGSFLGGVFKGILIGVSAAFDGIKVVAEFLTPVISFLVDVFNAIAPVLSDVAEWVGVVVGLFANLGSSGNTLKSILSSAWNNIKSAISIAGSGISAIINGIKSVFSSAGSAGVALKNALSTAWNAIKSVISTVGNAISSVINGIKSVFSGLTNSGNSLKSGISGAWNGMKSAVSGAASGIKGIVDGVKSAFNGLKNINLADAGRAIMDGFLDGLKEAWEGVTKFIGGIGSWIKDHKGPIEYDRKLLIPAGNAIMAGLNEGLQDKFQQVRNTVAAITDEMANGFSPTLANDVMSAQRLALASGYDVSTESQRTTIIEVPVYLHPNAPREIGRATAKYVEEENSKTDKIKKMVRGER